MGHKSKKSHKKSSSSLHKKSSKRESSSSRHHSKKHGSPLGDSITAALMVCPSLLEDLPQMINALDKGEMVNIDNISNVPMRDGLHRVFSTLLSEVLGYAPKEGYYRTQKDKPVAQYILDILQKDRVIVDPRKLSFSEQLSSRTPPLQLLALLKSYPALIDELPQIFDQILDGNAVSLDSIGDEDLVEASAKLFRNLGLIETSRGFDVPDDRKEADTVLDCLEHFEEVFKAYHRIFPDKNDVESDSDESSSSTSSSKGEMPSGGRHVSHDADIHSSSSSEASDDDIGPTSRVVGPSMPTAREREKATLLMSQYERQQQLDGSVSRIGDDDDDDDDEVGPAVQTSEDRSAASLRALAEQRALNVPIGMAGVSLTADDRHESSQDAQDLDSQTITKREDWILTPGDCKTLAELSADPTKLTNRKFQTGKQAKKSAEELQIRNAYLRSLEQQGKNETEDVFKEMHSRPSLMDMHLAKRSKVDITGSQKRTPFDRDRDMASQKKLTKADVERLVENSRELSDRFSRGAPQQKSI